MQISVGVSFVSGLHSQNDLESEWESRGLIRLLNFARVEFKLISVSTKICPEIVIHAPTRADSQECPRVHCYSKRGRWILRRKIGE